MTSLSVFPPSALVDAADLGDVFDDAVTGLAVLDMKGRFVRVNPALCELLGRTPEELIGIRAVEITHPDDQATSQATIGELFADPGRTSRVRKRYLRPDGSVVVVDRTVTALRDRSGALTGMFTQVFDATEVSDAQEAVRSSERRFRALVGKSWDIISLLDRRGRYLYVSPAVSDVFDVNPDSLIGRDPFDFIDDPDGHVAKAFFSAPTDGRASRAIEYRLRHTDGSWRWAESVTRNLLDDPAIGGIVVTTRDITARRRRSAQQDALATLSRAALAGSDPDDFLDQTVRTVADVLGVKYCSLLELRPDGWLRVAHRSGPPVVTRSFPAVVDGVPSARCVTALLERRSLRWGGETPDLLPELVDHGLRSGLATVIHDGEPWGLLVAHAPWRNAFAADDMSFVESVANVLGAAIGRRRVEDELRAQACTDALTGLPNRASLLQQLRGALVRQQERPGPVGVLFVDTDDLKLINDSLGHPAGDAVISAVASRIVAALRQGDVVARFGGDEFVVLCEGADANEAASIAERIRVGLNEPVQLPDRTVTVTVSIGIAVAAGAAVGEDGVAARAQDLLAEADTAMYQAKTTGKDRAALFGAAMRHEVNERLEIVDGLRRALRDEKLEVHYQPIVDVETGLIGGAEALVRWPEGRVGPDRFIAIAEDSGLIHPLGTWVLETTLQQLAAWQAQGSRLRVTVNVSGMQLDAGRLVDTVAGLLRTTGADPTALTLEVTESAVMGDVDDLIGVMEGLHDLGVTLALDDFGTGHSSLSRLALLPFDIVKIDRSFIARSKDEERAAILVEAIASLCSTLGLHAVAEGVETTEQLEAVRRLGVPYAQGFLLGRPVPAACFPVVVDVPPPAPRVVDRRRRQHDAR